ncbi:PLD nuclease N-terminal domain-containing protein [Leifsonia flava]|uniref:Cardiolipin synthase N-terminal domain-containing protein n=1 Tax=Orlajensenia leifsoniae TaxID=2561933 RepID=A0A4Y9R3J7_9MICO|nr:PLD nuclease N-terminal domain-containing protein [Leifsonia flava]TFV98025.1 hypothetical protein E4M00_08230 [Leifsonia flava]
MTRLLVGLVVAAVVFMIYSIIDCALFDRRRVRGLPKGVWLLVIILVPLVGGALWFLVGRGRRAKSARGGARTVAPDDDPEFLGRLKRDAAQEERIRRMEQELADLDARAEAEDPETDVDPDHRTDGDKPGRADA